MHTQILAMLHLSPLMVLWKRPLRRICRVRREHRTGRPIVDPHLFKQSNPYSPTIALVQKAIPVQPAHWTGWRKGPKLGPWRRTTLEHRAGGLTSGPCQLGRHVQHRDYATSRPLHAPQQGRPNATVAAYPVVVGLEEQRFCLEMMRERGPFEERRVYSGDALTWAISWLRGSDVVDERQKTGNRAPVELGLLPRLGLSDKRISCFVGAYMRPEYKGRSQHSLALKTYQVAMALGDSLFRCMRSCPASYVTGTGKSECDRRRSPSTGCIRRRHQREYCGNEKGICATFSERDMSNVMLSLRH